MLGVGVVGRGERGGFCSHSRNSQNGARVIFIANCFSLNVIKFHKRRNKLNQSLSTTYTYYVGHSTISAYILCMILAIVDTFLILFFFKLL